MKRRPHIKLLASAAVPTIEVYDTIVSNDEYAAQAWYCELDEGCSCEDKVTVMSSGRFKELVAQAKDVGKLLIKINSDGGNYATALEMLETLREFSGEVTTRVVGYAASAASLLLLAGDEREAAPGSIVMIHEPRKEFFGTFTRLELERELSELKAARESITGAYASRLKVSREQIAKWLEEEKFFSAEEALRYGFITAILSESDEDSALLNREESRLQILRKSAKRRSAPSVSARQADRNSPPLDPYATVATRRRHLAGATDETRSLP